MSTTTQDINHSTFRILWIIFIFFIIYGTLIPFNLSPDKGSFAANVSNINWIPFIDSDGSRASIPDMVQNILFFIPFGFLGVFSIKYDSKIRHIIKLTLLGSIVSGFVEVLQLFTNDRTSSITDILTNSAGAFIGAALAFLLLGTYSKFIHIEQIQKFRNDKYFYLVLITSIIVAIGALQPFDFTLDVGVVGSQIKYLIKNPVEFNSVFSDEAVVFIRLFFLGYVCSLWLKRINLRDFYTKGFFLSSLIGLFFEMSQIIVQSRMPSFQDALVILAATYFGSFFSRIRLKNVPGNFWAFAIILATFVSAGLQVLSPYKFEDKAGNFNWIPFLAYYERTTFLALANFIESMLIYLPMGFILRYIYSRDDQRTNIFFIAVIGLIISSSLEFMQIWVSGRYADITDILGAIAGTILGTLICSHWKKNSVLEEGIRI